MILCGIKLRKINDVSLANSSYSTTEVQSDGSAEGETACVERDRRTETLLYSRLSLSSLCFPMFSVLVTYNWGLHVSLSVINTQLFEFTLSRDIFFKINAFCVKLLVRSKSLRHTETLGLII